MGGVGLGTRVCVWDWNGKQTYQPANRRREKQNSKKQNALTNLLGGLVGVLDGLLEVEVHDVVVVVRHVRLPALHPQLARAGALVC